MTREHVKQQMSLEDAIQVFRDTNCYGTMDIAKSVILEHLQQEPCEDAISREAYIERFRKWAYSEYGHKMDDGALAIRVAMSLPSVKPQYTEAEIQKIQELEQAQLEKAYEIGKADAVVKKMQEPKWIPVSERLPEEDGDYLTTIKGIGFDYNEIRSFSKNLYEVDESEFCDKEGPGWYYFDHEYGDIEETDVIAWMPLQKPYTAESEES